MYIYWDINLCDSMHPKILEEVGLLVNIWGVNLNCKLALNTNLKKISLCISLYNFQWYVSSVLEWE